MSATTLTYREAMAVRRPVYREAPRPEVSAPRPRYVFIDALRGFAALWVVIYHASEGGHLAMLRPSLPGAVRWFLDAGHFGVPIFFVLSGYVIAHSIGDDRVTPGYLGRFVLRRSLRLDPPYWASIVITVALAALAGAVVPGKEARLPAAVDVQAHLFYTQDLLGVRAINPAYWTLCLEVQFYLVFCACLGLAQRYPSARVFVMAAVASLLWPLGIAPPIAPGLFLPQWYGFLLGAIGCWAVKGRVRWRWFYLYAAALAVAAGIGGNSTTAVCVLVAVGLAEVARAGRLGSWLGWRPLQFAGLISYSLYLVHGPITGAAFNVGYRLTGRSPATEAVWFVLVGLANIAAAAGLWYLVERPSILLGRLWRDRRVGAMAASA